MEIVPANLRDPRIETAMIGTRDGLTFEVDQCGEGEELALCLHGFPEHSFSSVSYTHLTLPTNREV